MTPLAPTRVDITTEWLAATSANPEAVAYAADQIAAGLSFGVAGYAEIEPGDATYYPVIVTTLGPEMARRQGATHAVTVPNLGVGFAVHLGDEISGPALLFPDYVNDQIRGHLAPGSVIVIAALLTELAERLYGRP